MAGNGMLRADFPRDGSDERFRDLTVRLGRTCERQPRSVYAVREGSGHQWRTLRKMFHECLEASGGRALPDIEALLAEFQRDARQVAGVERPRSLAAAICAEAVVDSASDAIEPATALDPTLARVEALIERKLAEMSIDRDVLEAAYQWRDGAHTAHRRVA